MGYSNKKILLSPRCRFGDASWGVHENFLGFTAGCGSRSNSGTGFYGSASTMGERNIFGSNWNKCNFSSGTSSFGKESGCSSTRTHEVKDGFQSFHDKNQYSCLQTQTRLNTTDDLKPALTGHLHEEVLKERTSFCNTNINGPSDFSKTNKTTLQEWSMLKRKAVSDYDLDLDLSLRLTSSDHDENQKSSGHHKVIDSNLSLSLYSQSSSSNLTSLKEGGTGRFDDKEQGRRASTLDLTI